jgi:hypothetical protein
LSGVGDTDDEADRSFSYNGDREEEYSDDIDEDALDRHD